MQQMQSLLVSWRCKQFVKGCASAAYRRGCGAFPGVAEPRGCVAVAEREISFSAQINRAQLDSGWRRDCHSIVLATFLGARSVAPFRKPAG